MIYLFLVLKFLQESSTTTSVTQNEAEKEAASVVDETQATANNANEDVQAAGDSDVEMPAESSTNTVVMDVVEVVPY